MTYSINIPSSMALLFTLSNHRIFAIPAAAKTWGIRWVALEAFNKKLCYAQIH
jgi:hypothetical protein